MNSSIKTRVMHFESVGSSEFEDSMISMSLSLSITSPMSTRYDRSITMQTSYSQQNISTIMDPYLSIPSSKNRRFRKDNNVLPKSTRPEQVYRRLVYYPVLLHTLQSSISLEKSHLLTKNTISYPKNGEITIPSPNSLSS
jgi:hypothetical protein